MAKLTFNLYSKALMSNTMVTVILPIWTDMEDYLEPEEQFQTLWLLHGGMGSYIDYTEKSNISWLSQKHHFAVVIPDCGTNHYNNVPGGPSYFTYITEELPYLLRKYLPLSPKREDNFILGLSMGGFGASKCAFKYPEKYSVAAFLSTGPQNGLQLRSTNQGAETPGYDRYDRIFGGADKIPHSDNDPWFLLENDVKDGKDLPLIYDCCGTEDGCYPSYLAFLDFAASLGVNVISHESEGYHSWEFWNMEIERFIDWNPLLKHKDYIRKIHETIPGIITPQKDSTLQDRVDRVKEIYYKQSL